MPSVYVCLAAARAFACRGAGHLAEGYGPVAPGGASSTAFSLLVDADAGTAALGGGVAGAACCCVGGEPVLSPGAGWASGGGGAGACSGLRRSVLLTELFLAPKATHCFWDPKAHQHPQCQVQAIDTQATDTPATDTQAADEQWASVPGWRTHRRAAIIARGHIWAVETPP
jgi:hypothetical protein